MLAAVSGTVQYYIIDWGRDVFDFAGCIGAGVVMYSVMVGGGCCLRLAQRCWPALVGWCLSCVRAFCGILL